MRFLTASDPSDEQFSDRSLGRGPLRPLCGRVLGIQSLGREVTYTSAGEVSHGLFPSSLRCLVVSVASTSFGHGASTWPLFSFTPAFIY